MSHLEELDKERKAAEADLQTHTCEIDELKKSLHSIADADLLRVNEAITLAELRRDRAQSRIEAIEAAMPAAEAADTEAKALVESAKAAVDAAVPKVEKLYSKIQKDVLDLLKIIDGANQVVGKANRVIGDNGTALPTVEGEILRRHLRPRTVISDHVFETWCYESTSAMLPDALQREVSPSESDPRRGVLRRGSSRTWSTTAVVLKKKRRIEFRTADRAYAVNLAAEIKLPSLHPAAPPWPQRLADMLGNVFNGNGLDGRPIEVEIVDVPEAAPGPEPAEADVFEGSADEAA